MWLSYGYRIHERYELPGDGTINRDDILFGRYRVICFLGRGSFGEVYLVEHLKLRTVRALKCIDKCRDLYAEAGREADILKNLKHPSIPTIYDIEEDEERVFIVEDYEEGVSLQSLISQNRHFTVKETVRVVLQLCGILEYLHDNGVYHHDIKPDNIIYDADNDSVKLIDYGSAACEGTAKEVRTGTRFFAAPEMYGSSECGGRADVYSVGALMLFMLTGTLDMQSLAGADSRITRIIGDCLKHSGNSRIPSITVLKKRLAQITKNRFISEDVILNIGFAGAFHGCGVTHTAFMAADYFKSKNMRAVVIEENDSRNMFGFAGNAGRLAFARGIYTLDGYDVIPEYYGCIKDGLYMGYNRVIRDYGVLHPDNIDRIAANNVVCLVVSAAPWKVSESADAVRTARAACSKSGSRLYVLVAPCSYARFKRFTEEQRIAGPVRIPYEP